MSFLSLPPQVVQHNKYYLLAVGEGTSLGKKWEVERKNNRPVARL